MEISRVNQEPGRARVDTTWLGLLAPEDTVVWQTPSGLRAGLEAKLAHGGVTEVFTAANRLSLELYRTGRSSAARELCRLQIRYAVQNRGNGEDSDLALLGLQAVVNIIRIDGYGSETGRALEGLRRLEGLADGGAFHFHGLAISSDIAEGDGPRADRVRAFARGNRIVETAKILFRRNRIEAAVSECRQLCEKWPTVASIGPFHAHEILSIQGQPWPGTESVAGTAPTLSAIDRLHRLAHPALFGTIDRSRAEAMELYRERERTGFSDDAAHGRFMAVLGSVLHQYGEPAAGNACFADACRLAAPAGPRLVNRIARQWTVHAGNSPSVPVQRANPELGPGDLNSLQQLAAERLGRTAAVIRTR
ncbi:hypothetical protein ABZ915_28805 [Streptomyces sp. NPDC046915]|uniref:hypothetical protein n=1 Tax=Streptomyces sp. NPDC046915 TaxID=3155257 RepID=UPI0033D705C5